MVPYHTIPWSTCFNVFDQAVSVQHAHFHLAHASNLGRGRRPLAPTLPLIHRGRVDSTFRFQSMPYHPIEPVDWDLIHFHAINTSLMYI